jgi:hypothetical protein
MKKAIRKFFKRITKRSFVYKAVIILSSLALIATSILPYIIR